MKDDRRLGRVSVPVVLSALASDALSAIGVQGSSMLGEALQSMLQGRHTQARDILLDELREGDKQLTDVGQVDEAAAIIFRYARAAQEGAARLNLRLMAKVIAAQAYLGNLVADEFLYYADMLASLRREEVILIASLHQHRVVAPEVWADNVRAWSKAQEQLVPNVFATGEVMYAAALGAARTGLLLSGPPSIGGPSAFVSSPMMDRLERLAPFKDALRQEGIAH